MSKKPIDVVNYLAVMTQSLYSIVLILDGHFSFHSPASAAINDLIEDLKQRLIIANMENPPQLNTTQRIQLDTKKILENYATSIGYCTSREMGLRPQANPVMEEWIASITSEDDLPNLAEVETINLGIDLTPIACIDALYRELPTEPPIHRLIKALFYDLHVGTLGALLHYDQIISISTTQPSSAEYVPYNPNIRPPIDYSVTIIH